MLRGVPEQHCWRQFAPQPDLQTMLPIEQVRGQSDFSKSILHQAGSLQLMVGVPSVQTSLDLVPNVKKA